MHTGCCLQSSLSILEAQLPQADIAAENETPGGAQEHLSRQEPPAVSGDLKPKLEYAEVVTEFPKQHFTEQTSLQDCGNKEEPSQCPTPLRSPLEAADVGYPTEHVG